MALAFPFHLCLQAKVGIPISCYQHEIVRASDEFYISPWVEVGLKNPFRTQEASVKHRFKNSRRISWRFVSIFEFKLVYKAEIWVGLVKRSADWIRIVANLKSVKAADASADSPKSIHCFYHRSVKMADFSIITWWKLSWKLHLVKLTWSVEANFGFSLKVERRTEALRRCLKRRDIFTTVDWGDREAHKLEQQPELNYFTFFCTCY